jgi:3-phenylpropionate/trans-cinnamate dioxygenase ferredoxin reductase component
MRSAPMVVVGGNQAGGTAATTLRSEGYDGEVVIVGEDPVAPYERPALSKGYLTSAKTFDEVLTRPTDFYAEHRIETRFGERAVRVDVDRHEVELAGGERIGYAKLLLATGTRNRRPPIHGLDLEGVHDLRTMRDAELLRAEVREGGSAVVLGMGFIGSEVAASLRQCGMEVTVVELFELPLAHALGVEIGRALRDLHAEHGVTLLLGERVTALRGAKRVGAVALESGREVACDLVVFGFGVDPVVDLAESAGIQTGNGIVVDEFLRTSVPDVFAAGDVASQLHPVVGRHVRVEHWQNAVLQGRTAARNMLGQEVVHDEVPWFWSEQYGTVLHYAGFHEAWDQTVGRGDIGRRRGVVFHLSKGVLVGVAGLNQPRDVRFAMDLIKKKVPVSVEALRDESVNVRTLLTPPAPDR